MPYGPGRARAGEDIGWVPTPLEIAAPRRAYRGGGPVRVLRVAVREAIPWSASLDQHPGDATPHATCPDVGLPTRDCPGSATDAIFAPMPISRNAHVPPGSQDLLADDVRIRRQLQRTWFTLAEGRGYQEVIPPTFEYEEVFTRGGGPELSSRLIRFIDQDGRIVALRADYTSSIARVAATRLHAQELPLRLCYSGKVYRQEPEGGRRGRELFQMGAELIGEPGVDGDLEILRLAIDTLGALDIREFQINIGEVRFIRPLLAGLAPTDAERLRTAIDRRDRRALAQASRDFGPPAAVARALLELPELIGRGDVLRRARSLASGADAEAAVERLRAIDSKLTERERTHVVYDLGEIRGLGYYTGLQFEVFAAGVGRAIGFGGRYDHLLALYGSDRAAVGFALETDALAELTGWAP
jgi:ATP phosphoribosyltransferase regulatory subunit